MDVEGALDIFDGEVTDVESGFLLLQHRIGQMNGFDLRIWSCDEIVAVEGQKLG